MQSPGSEHLLELLHQERICSNPKKIPIGEDFSSPMGNVALKLELRFEGKLIQPWGVVRVYVRNLSEGRAAEL